jgi:hypothetical protein
MPLAKRFHSALQYKPWEQSGKTVVKEGTDEKETKISYHTEVSILLKDEQNTKNSIAYRVKGDLPGDASEEYRNAMVSLLAQKLIHDFPVKKTKGLKAVLTAKRKLVATHEFPQSA